MFKKLILPHFILISFFEDLLHFVFAGFPFLNHFLSDRLFLFILTFLAKSKIEETSGPRAPQFMVSIDPFMRPFGSMPFKMQNESQGLFGHILVFGIVIIDELLENGLSVHCLSHIVVVSLLHYRDLLEGRLTSFAFQFEDGLLQVLNFLLLLFEFVLIVKLFAPELGQCVQKFLIFVALLLELEA